MWSHYNNSIDLQFQSHLLLLSVAVQSLLDEVILTDPRRPTLRPSFATAKSFSSFSSESTTSRARLLMIPLKLLFLVLLSVQGTFSPVAPTFAEIDAHEDGIYSFPIASKVEILLWPDEGMCKDELRTSYEPAEVDPSSLSIGCALAQAAAD